MGLVALKHVGSSYMRDQTWVPCIGRQSLYHWAREALITYICLSKLLVINSNFNLYAHYRNQGMWSWLVPLSTSPHPHMLFKRHLINTNPVMVKRGLLWITRCPFHLYGSETIRTEDAAVAAKSLQLGPTLCDPIDGSPPGSSVPGILQARKLE